MPRRNPFDELERMFERMNQQFAEASRSWEEDGLTRGWDSWMGSVEVDVAERDDEYVVTADLPGFEADDVDVRLDDHVLVIEAEREESADEEDANYVRRERRQRTASRRVRIPGSVETDEITASLNNGVLTVHLPKSTTGEGTRIEVE